MSLVNSLLNKPVEVTELQQKAQKIQKNADVNVSNLFTGRQTDHSRYVRATVKSAEAVRSAMDNKMNAMTSLLQAQINYEEGSQAENNASYFGPLDLSYSRRARIGARSGQILNFDKDRQLQHDSDASSDKERIDARAADIASGVPAAVSEKVHIASPVRSSGAATKVQARVSIRV